LAIGAVIFGAISGNMGLMGGMMDGVISIFGGAVTCKLKQGNLQA